MRLLYKDTKQIYIAYSLGEMNGKMHYTDIKAIRGNVSNVMGEADFKAYGKTEDYDREILFECNEDTKYIDITTKIWVDVVPNSRYDEADYTIVKVGSIIEDVFAIAIKSKSSDLQIIWYAIDNNIYSAKVLFDFNTLKARIPKNKYLPITEQTKVWYRNPKGNLFEQNGLMTLTDKDIINDTVELIFEE